MFTIEYYAIRIQPTDLNILNYSIKQFTNNILLFYIILHIEINLTRI